MRRASQPKHAFCSKRRKSFADSQHNRGPGPRALSKSGARGASGMALFDYCNGLLVGRVRPAMSAGPPAPAPGPRTTGGGGGGGGGSSPVWRGACSKYGLFSPGAAGRCAFRPPPPPSRPPPSGSGGLARRCHPPPPPPPPPPPHHHHGILSELPVARMLPIGPGGPQSGFSALRYVRRDFRKKKSGPRTPRPPPVAPGPGFLRAERGRAA
jgi:hypothetical protein